MTVPDRASSVMCVFLIYLAVYQVTASRLLPTQAAKTCSSCHGLQSITGLPWVVLPRNRNLEQTTSFY